MRDWHEETFGKTSCIILLDKIASTCLNKHTHICIHNIYIYILSIYMYADCVRVSMNVIFRETNTHPSGHQLWYVYYCVYAYILYICTYVCHMQTCKHVCTCLYFVCESPKIGSCPHYIQRHKTEPKGCWCQGRSNILKIVNQSTLSVTPHQAQNRWITYQDGCRLAKTWFHLVQMKVGWLGSQACSNTRPLILKTCLVSRNWQTTN